MVRIEKMSRLHPYAGVELFSMKILGLRPYLHDFLTKGRSPNIFVGVTCLNNKEGV